MAIYIRDEETKKLNPLNIPAIKGKDGISPIISIGEVTTLEAGNPATVTKKGTDENPVFNFGIPKGLDGGVTIDDTSKSNSKTWSSEKIEDYVLTNVGAIWSEITGGQVSISNTMDGFLREVEILGNTIQNPEDLEDIQHLGTWNEEKQGYEIEITVSNNPNNEAKGYQEFKTTILLPCQLMKVGTTFDRLYWDNAKNRYVVEKNTLKFLATGITRGIRDDSAGFVWLSRVNGVQAKDKSLIIDNSLYVGNRDSDWVNLKVSSDFYYENGYTITEKEAVRFLTDHPVNVICARSKVDQIIETDITEELRLPTFMNNTYLKVTGGIEGTIKAKAPVDGGQVIGTLVENNTVLQQEIEELKAVNESQDLLLKESIFITDQMLMIIEPLISNEASLLSNENNDTIINLYASIIKRRLKKINQVPLKYREQVKKILGES